MVLNHSRIYLCNYCINSIEKEEDGFIIFGTISVTSSRGLKSRFGEIPTDANYNNLINYKTCICKTCFKKRLNL